MNEVEKLARNIITTGKMIKELVFNVQTKHLKECGAHKRFGGLSLPQLEVVKLVRKKGAVSMIELSEMLRVAPPSATTMVDRLVEKGILVRRQSEVDRRKVIVEVSPVAIEDIIGVENAVIDMFVELLEKIGSDTGKKWFDVLEQVKLALANV